MKSDLDRLMKEHTIDVLLVNGPGAAQPGDGYITGGGHITTRM